MSHYLMCFLAIVVFSDLSNCDNRYGKVSNLKTQASIYEQSEAAQDVIKRILPSRFGEFEITVDNTLPDNSFNLFKNKTTNGRVLIFASSGVAVCRAFNYYLKYYLKSQISWDGNHLNELPEIFPDVDFTVRSSNKFIYYQNLCTFSYSFVWWQWDDWRRHLDWMALQGINLFLAPVQELIWTRVYHQLNLTDAEIDEHFAGPAFLSWQRMGNIRGWGGPLSSNYKRFSSALQNQIILNARRLGMIVALPSFTGHVPDGIMQKFSYTKFSRGNSWNKFPERYCCPLYLEPTNWLFHHIGTIFLQEIIEEYGTDHIYFSDPLNEVEPDLIMGNDPEFLVKAARQIYNVMSSVDEDAVWLLQGWMFANQAHFWTNDLIKSFLTANEIGTMLILDLQSERVPQYERTNSYFGQPFIWCMLNNFGGTLGMHASIGPLISDPMRAKSMVNSTMVGFGLTPEGIDTNYFIYELALEIGWEMKPVNLSRWFDMYLWSRYGERDEQMVEAWMGLAGSVYNYTGSQKYHDNFAINTRPNIGYQPTIYYDPKHLTFAWSKYLNVSWKFRDNKLFTHDLVDLTRQNLQILAERYWIKIFELYKNRAILEILKFITDFMTILQDMERILKTHENFILGKWLDASNHLAVSVGDEKIKDLYESNARYQISIWGPKGRVLDYANKQWSGVVDELFIPRFNILFNMLHQSLINHERITNQTNINDIMFNEAEMPFVNGREYSTETEGDSVDVSEEIFERWSNHKRAAYLPTIPHDDDPVPIEIFNGYDWLVYMVIFVIIMIALVSYRRRRVNDTETLSDKAMESQRTSMSVLSAK